MTVTGIITAIIVGAIVGALGRLVVPGRQPIPIWLTIVIGIVSAFIGTFIARALGIPTQTNGIDWLLVRRPRAEVCTSYPGRPEDLVVRTRSEVLARCHLRLTTFAQAERGGQLEIDGPRPTVRAFLACIRPSPFAVTA